MYMLDFVIKFVALTVKLYLCIAIISKEIHKCKIMGVVQNYSCILLIRSLNSLQKETQVPAQLLWVPIPSGTTRDLKRADI